MNRTPGIRRKGNIFNDPTFSVRDGSKHAEQQDWASCQAADTLAARWHPIHYKSSKNVWNVHSFFCSNL
jgi:hypothetical protein